MTAPTPAFPGRIDPKGLLLLDDRPRFMRWLKRLADRRVDVIVRRAKSKRSLQQLRYVRWVGKFIALEYCGCDHHDYQAHAHWAYEHLLGAFTGWVEIRGDRVPKRRLSNLNTKETSEMIDWIPRYCAQEFDGLIVPLPNEVVDLDAYAERSA